MPVFPEWRGKAGLETERPRFPSKDDASATQPGNKTQRNLNRANRTTDGNRSRAQTRNTSVTLPRQTAADARKPLIPDADANLATHNSAPAAGNYGRLSAGTTPLSVLMIYPEAHSSDAVRPGSYRLHLAAFAPYVRAGAGVVA